MAKELLSADSVETQANYTDEHFLKTSSPINALFTLSQKLITLLHRDNIQASFK
jgi:hypothetical protein